MLAGILTALMPSISPYLSGVHAVLGGHDNVRS